MLRIEQQDDEEFQEADVLWPDAAQGPELPPQVFYYPRADSDDEFSSEHPPMKPQTGQRGASSPIDIPGRNRKGAKGAEQAQPGLSKLACSYGGGGGSGSVRIGSGHAFVPPHVIVDRRTKREKAMRMFVVPSGRAGKIREQCHV